MKLKSNQQIYFDNAATTPVDPRVFKKMQPYFSEKFGNPSAFNTFGKNVRDDIDEARAEIAEFEANAPKTLTVQKVAEAYRRMCAKPEDGQRWIGGFRKAGVTSLEGQSTGQVISFRDKRSGG